MAKRKYDETDMFDEEEDFDVIMDEENTENGENGESTTDDIENDLVCIDLQLEEVGKKSFQCSL